MTSQDMCKCGHHKDYHFLRQTPSLFQYTECTQGKIISLKECPECKETRYNEIGKHHWRMGDNNIFQQCVCDKFEQIERVWKDIWDSKAGKYFDPDTGKYKEDGIFVRIV